MMPGTHRLLDPHRASFQFAVNGPRVQGVIFVTVTVGDAGLVAAQRRATRLAVNRSGDPRPSLLRVLAPPVHRP